MKKPVVDYRQFRLSKIHEPEYSHLLLLTGWILYFLLYFLTENLIPAEICTPVHCRLDDVIPFCEWFIIPYVLWYPLIVGTLLYYLLYSVDSFKLLQVFFIITQIIAMTIYVVFPNRQELRPEVFPRENILTGLIGLIYSVDTNTGVTPSLHVVYSLGIATSWMREKSVSKSFKGFMLVIGGLICISVAFVKQHSVIDIVTAVPLYMLGMYIVGKMKVLREEKNKK